MLATIIGWLSQSWFGQIISAGIQWWAERKAKQDKQNSAERQAEIDHQNDGAQSVADGESADAQNAALDQLADQLDNPAEIIVTPGGSNGTQNPSDKT